MCPMQMRALLVLICTLALTSPAQAMIAVSMFRAPLRLAAQEAAQCEGAVPGAYMVNVTLGDGSPRAELRADPGVTTDARTCIEHAFATQNYPDAQHGTIHLNYPMHIVPAE